MVERVDVAKSSSGSTRSVLCVCCPCVLQREPARILGQHGGGGFVPRRDGAEEGGRGEEEAVRAQEVAGRGHVVVGWVASRPFPAPLGPRAGRALSPLRPEATRLQQPATSTGGG